MEKSRFFSFSAMVFAVLLMTSCFVSFRNESISEMSTKRYSFDRATILTSIKLGKGDVFTLLPERTVATETPNAEIPTIWKYDDYYQIAKVYIADVLGSNIEEWKINKIDAFRECESEGEGLNGLNFAFFQESENTNGPYRVVHGIFINPGDNELSDTIKEYKDPIGNWVSKKPGTQKISSEMAYSIAESNGGEKYRNKYSNDCRILIKFGVVEGYVNAWQFIYRTLDNERSDRFEIIIDAENGDYKIVPK